MKTAIALALLAGCSGTVILPPADGGAPPADDDASPPEVDAGTDSGLSTRVDSGPTPEADAGSPEVDAGTPEPMLDGGSDSGPTIVEEDAGTTVDPDSGPPPSEDAGPPPPVDAGPPDAGPPPPVDAGPPPCAPDGFEPNDSLASAPVVSTMTDASDELNLDLTWSPDGDPADWVALETRRGLNTVRLTAYDSDAYSHVTVRVTCLSGLVWCRGVRATRPQPDSCEVTGAAGVALVDVACLGDGAADAWVGVVPSPEPLCGHHLRAVVESVP